MTRLNFVKAARKNYKEHGIKKGEAYYWWKFRFGGKYYSKTRPRRSRLTQSNFLATMMDAEDDLADALTLFSTGKSDFEALAGACDDAASAVQDAGNECESSRSNMPDSLQESDSGQLLQTRQDQCESIASDLENAASNIRDCAEDEDTAEEERRQQAEAEVEGINWDYE